MQRPRASRPRLFAFLETTEGGDDGARDQRAGRKRGGEGLAAKSRRESTGFVRPSGINGRENECHLFRNTHPENHGAGEKFTEKAAPGEKGEEIP